MAKHNSLNELFTATANAIRSKTGSTDPIVADDFPSAIENIEAGGEASEGFLIDTFVEPNKSNQIGDYFGLKIDFVQAETIGNDAWNYCEGLESVILRKAKTVEDRAFRDCPLLTSVSAPKLTTIGSNAFAYCYRLTTLDLPAVTSIGTQAFQGCDALTTLVLPSATNIGELAFADSYGLTSVDLPAATTIEGLAFRECPFLNTLILRTTETVCVAEFSAFSDTPMLTGQGHIYVPTVMYEYYRAGYEAALNTMMPGFFDILFRKIEDYPEICGTTE